MLNPRHSWATMLMRCVGSHSSGAALQQRHRCGCWKSGRPSQRWLGSVRTWVERGQSASVLDVDYFPKALVPLNLGLLFWLCLQTLHRLFAVINPPARGTIPSCLCSPITSLGVTRLNCRWTSAPNRQFDSLCRKLKWEMVRHSLSWALGQRRCDPPS